MFDVIEVQELDRLADAIPAGEPLLERARSRARRTAELVSGAVDVDPTLLDHDRSRDLDVCAEILRQLAPLARQAALTLEHARLTEAGAPPEEFVRIGRINPLAPGDLDALSNRAVETAERISAAALRDWNTPQRIRERSQRLLPSPEVITSLADQLADAVRPATALAHPAPAALQLAELADQLRSTAEHLTWARTASGSGQLPESRT